MRLYKSPYSESLAIFSEIVTVGLQSESVYFEQKKANGGISVGEIPSYLGGTYVRAPFSFLSFESVTVDTVVVVQCSGKVHSEKQEDVIFFLSAFYFTLGTGWCRCRWCMARKNGKGNGGK